jgi:hypothetical protein
LRYAHSTNSERNIFGCHWWIRICSPFRSTWVHPWFSMRFAFLNLQFSMLWLVRHFQYFFFHFRLTIVLTICPFSNYYFRYWNFAATKIEEILTIDLSFPDIETEMEIFDNISSTRRCLASQNNINVVTDCSSTYNFSCEGSGEWKP